MSKHESFEDYLDKNIDTVLNDIKSRMQDDRHDDALPGKDFAYITRISVLASVAILRQYHEWVSAERQTH